MNTYIYMLHEDSNVHVLDKITLIILFQTLDKISLIILLQTLAFISILPVNC